MDADIRIRGYEVRDLEDCRTLWVELTDWHRQIYDSPGIGGAEPGLHFDKHLATVGAKRLWVAVAGGQVIGLTGMIPGDGEAELEPLVVREAWRGQGVGRALAEVVVAHCRAQGLRELKVRPVGRNAQAIRAFHALGFDVLGHVEMFMDLDPTKKRTWLDAERLAGRGFRV